MEDLDKKKALRELLIDVRNAHNLIVEYQERIQHIIEFIKKDVNRCYDIFHYPNRTKTRTYGVVTEFYFGTKDEYIETKGEYKKNDFRIILATGNSEREQSELIFILDKNGSALLQGNDIRTMENYLYSIINRDKAVLESLENENCVIQRRNIEDFYDEEALKKEWEEISNEFPPCWLNGRKETGE